MDEPMHGTPILFWLIGSDDPLPGYFKGSSYWTGKHAYAPTEVWQWVYRNHPSGAIREGFGPIRP